MQHRFHVDYLTMLSGEDVFSAELSSLTGRFFTCGFLDELINGVGCCPTKGIIPKTRKEAVLKVRHSALDAESPEKRSLIIMGLRECRT
jgi:hypothetical protein